MKTMIDPPSGWRYGFPKQFPDEVKDEDLEKWVVENGYPQKLVDDGMMKHCRFWEVKGD